MKLASVVGTHFCTLPRDLMLNSHIIFRGREGDGSSMTCVVMFLVKLRIVLTLSLPNIFRTMDMLTKATTMKSRRIRR